MCLTRTPNNHREVYKTEEAKVNAIVEEIILSPGYAEREGPRAGSQLVVSIDSGSFVWCPYNKSPSVWSPYIPVEEL